MKGLYKKYKIFKQCPSCNGTGESLDKYHCGDCMGMGMEPVPSDHAFFVLNLTTDKVARDAARFYAAFVNNAELACDLKELVLEIENEKA